VFARFRYNDFWRLRQMRANGYGNSILSSICKLLVLRYLENEHVREPPFDALRWGMSRKVMTSFGPPWKSKAAWPQSMRWASTQFRPPTDCYN
jgi:hypothetical protein